MPNKKIFSWKCSDSYKALEVFDLVMKWYVRYFASTYVGSRGWLDVPQSIVGAEQIKDAATLQTPLSSASSWARSLQSLQITMMLRLLICPLLVIIGTNIKKMMGVKSSITNIMYENNSGDLGHRLYHHTECRSSLAAHCKVILCQQEQRSLITIYDQINVLTDITRNLTNTVNQTTTEKFPSGTTRFLIMIWIFPQWHSRRTEHSDGSTRSSQAWSAHSSSCWHHCRFPWDQDEVTLMVMMMIRAN